MILRENKKLFFDRTIKVNLSFILKKIINCFHRVFYKVMYCVCHPVRTKETKYNVSICAIFRDEGDYLKEWIEFHLIAGVDHFYLYNNFSNDNYLEILQPYIDRGIVSLKDWPYKQGQFAAYEDFFNSYAADSKWVALIDIDEFIIPNKYNTIGEFLNKFDNRPCVIVYWKVLGSSGLVHRDIKGLITEDLIVGYRKYINIGKVFFNTKYTYDLKCHKGNDMHSMWAKYKGIALPPVNAFDRVCTYGIHSVPSCDMPIQINHYLIKSYDEYIEKKSKRGGGVHDQSMHNTDYYFRNEQRCQMADYSAYKYLVKLKLAMRINNDKEKLYEKD